MSFLLCAGACLIYVAIIGRVEEAESQTLFQAHAVYSLPRQSGRADDLGPGG